MDRRRNAWFCRQRGWFRFGDGSGFQEIFAERRFDVGDELTENRRRFLRVRLRGSGRLTVCGGNALRLAMGRSRLGFFSNHRAGQEFLAERGFQIGDKFL
jgi:hypothetical protein